VASIALDPAGADLRDRLAAAAAGIQEELENGRPSGAVRAVAQLMQMMEATPPGPTAEALRNAVSPLLTASLLAGAASCSLEEGTRAAAQRVLSGGGGAATEVLRDRLLAANAPGERKHFLELLRRQPEGLRYLILLLQHADADAVRRAADLTADERVREAVPALARLALHPEPAARQAILRALAVLATPEAVETLGHLLEEPDAEVRVDAARALRGSALGMLVPVLVRAARRERNPHSLGEFARALGRIGTPEAVGALTRWAESAGWRVWRRQRGRRRAAVDGLLAAGGAGAVGVLRALTRDSDGDVRRAALEALEDLSIAARPHAP
jgi:HEAT repeat protein